MVLPVLLLIAAPWKAGLAVSAGGLSVASTQLKNIAWHDPASGYFAIKSYECDGAHRSVLITKDRRMLEEVGYDTTRFGRPPKEELDRAVEDHPFAPAAKNGVTIGMSRSAVLRKLGKPTRTAVRGKSSQFYCALYKQVHYDRKDEGEVLRNTYIFKSGKLIEMAIHLDGIPGCGEDSLSDQGWPWSRF